MDPILYWNEVALEVHRRDFSFALDANGKEIGPQHGGPTRTSRALAIVHCAMYDAWNGASSTPNSYLSSKGVTPPAVIPGSSIDAAVAGAATSTLKALFSNSAAYIEDRMQNFFAKFMPPLPTPSQMSDGADYGRRIAQAMLDLRKNDGADLPDGYVGGNAPGDHRPDPYNPNQGYLGARWGEVKPFCIESTGMEPLANYLPAYPAFGTPGYNTDLLEVRRKGARSRGTGATARTATEEATGLYWAYDGAKDLGTPPRLYNQIVRAIADKQGNTHAANARLFALVNAGMADAGIIAWRAKYFYNLWRPVIGVREDDSGTGPTGLGTGAAAGGDPFWEPYGAPNSNRKGVKHFTPNFPAYPSGHATFGTTVFEIVRAFYPAVTVEFDFVSDELNGKTLDVDGSVRTYMKRHYNLTNAIAENLSSRVWLGVHWRFDGVGGKSAGEAVATRVMAGTTCFP